MKIISLSCLSRFVVIDADRHKEDEDGIETLRSLCAKHGELPPHPAFHRQQWPAPLFQAADKREDWQSKAAPGLETRGFKPDNDGGFVIASGSQLNDGRHGGAANHVTAGMLPRRSIPNVPRGC